MDRSSHHYSLKLHIASIFIILFSILGAILIFVSYQSATEFQRQHTIRLTQQNALQIKTSFEKLANPVFTFLDTLATAPFVNTSNNIDQTKWLTSLKHIMDRNPDVISIYYGKQDDSSFFIRSTAQSFMKKQFEAPEQSTMVVDFNGNDGTRHRIFYDSQLQPIQDQYTYGHTYKPTSRPWYQIAPDNGNIRITKPYLYYFIKKTGVTLARKTPNGEGVLAADFTLKALSQQLKKLAVTPNSQLALINEKFEVIAHNSFTGKLTDSMNGIPKLQELTDSPLISILDNGVLEEKNWQFELNDETWQINLIPLQFDQNFTLWLTEAVPHSELMAEETAARNKQIQITLAVIIFSLVVICGVSKLIAKPLSVLNNSTDCIRRFDFSRSIYPRSYIKEVDELAQSIHMMANTLNNFLGLLREVANSKDFSALLDTVVEQSQEVTGADSVLLLINTPEQREQFTVEASRTSTPANIDISTYLQSDPHVCEQLKAGQYCQLSHDSPAHAPLLEQITASEAYLFPLTNKELELVGIVLLGYAAPTTQIQKDKHIFISEFLGFAEISKENLDLIEQQKQLFQSFIELIASAIDTKSPYTAGHCQRVPELTFMLTKVVEQDTRYYPEFSLDNNGWEALHIAAWLHDCGKATTPEFVVDKATKLETIYDRIHEIRMRFEVMKRDVEIEYCQSVIAGKNTAELQIWRDQHLQQLDDDFKFIAECNIGGEFMDDDKITQIETIAQRRWKRTIDDQLGISWEEKKRKQRSNAETLPIMEYVLDDKLEHIIDWPDKYNPKDKPAWRFKMDVPEHQYNRGELYNLKINRGTLTDEERFKINDHIVQTIVMLERLPYPAHLKQIPQIAGGHHEKMDGTGYPLRLKKDELPVTARIMAIADIFEALTACDRPYKKAKPLSEALNIMAFMANDQHIDKELFCLFIQQKIYLTYANKYLGEDQFDHIDEKGLLAMLESDLLEQPELNLTT